MRSDCGCRSARDVDVLLQFLVEAIVLSLAGGAMGVALGFGASWAVSSLMQWSAIVTSGAVLLSFGCAAGIGIFFGFYLRERRPRSIR